jgi:glutamate--cysteine ligase
VSRDSTERAVPVASADDLVRWMREGEKPPERWRIGLEHEKIGLLADTHERVPYEGPRGIRELLERIAAEDAAWRPVREEGRTIALERDGASITLEPGGQLELSGAPLRTIHEICREFTAHLDLVKRASAESGLVWLGLGHDPLHSVAETPRIPKSRYAIMRGYLPSRGALALDMMHLTATVQANLDYASEQDMVDKLRTALGVSPLVSAIFANSSISGGKPNGFVSRRVWIWRETDPDRTGLLPFVFERDFGYRDYVEWALDVPMFFLVREGVYRPTPGITFRRFLERGIDGERPTLRDWDLHLTTLFPEARLKRFIEVRGADAVPPGLTCSLPALWKGILYEPAARASAWALVADWSTEEREAALVEVARRGLRARVAGRSVLELARELAAVAREGLRRIGHAGRVDADERPFLDPIAEQLERGESPGQVVLDRWQGDWNGSIERLIAYARY